MFGCVFVEAANGYRHGLESMKRKREAEENLRRAREQAILYNERFRRTNDSDVIEGECERVADPLELPAPEGKS